VKRLVFKICTAKVMLFILDRYTVVAIVRNGDADSHGKLEIQN
jgi:hypothetical protein